MIFHVRDEAKYFIGGVAVNTAGKVIHGAWDKKQYVAGSIADRYNS